MKKEKILIYDLKKGYSRFLKLYLSSKYEFEVYNNINNTLSDLKIDEYLAIIMIINDFTDLADLVYLQSFKSNIIIYCRIESINKRIKHIENIVQLDLDKIKREVLIDINTNLDFLLRLKNEIY